MDDDKKQQLSELAEKLRSEQNFPAAAIGGGVAAILAGVGYGMVVARWPVIYGFAAAGVGIVVGLAMAYLGRGISTRFAVLAAIYTIAGCLLGTVVRVIVNTPRHMLQEFTFSTLAERTMSYLSLGMVLYWFVAVFCAVFLARRALSRNERLAIGMTEKERQGN